MKHNLALLFTAALLLTAGTALAQGNGPGPGPGPNPDPAPSPGPQADECSLGTSLLDLPAEPLSAREQSDLLFSREEEKLARDVYLSLRETWGLRIFRKIARSETSHMAGVEVLLDKYGLADPIGENGVGVFSDPTLQGFYEDLVAQGNLSVIEALRVGVYIEEMDLADLYTMLRKADNLDVDMLYQNLSKGSRNHLRAFHRQLVRRGGTYEPILFLSTETFEDIVNTPPEKGLLDEEGDWICGGWSRGTLD